MVTAAEFFGQHISKITCDRGSSQPPLAQKTLKPQAVRTLARHHRCTYFSAFVTTVDTVSTQQNHRQETISAGNRTSACIGLPREGESKA